MSFSGYQFEGEISKKYFQQMQVLETSLLPLFHLILTGEYAQHI